MEKGKHGSSKNIRWVAGETDVRMKEADSMNADKNREVIYWVNGKPLTYGTFIDACRAVGLCTGDTIFLHSDLLSMGELVIEDSQKILALFVSALQEVVGADGTLIMPTFTYSFLNEGGDISLLPVAGFPQAVAGKIRWVNQVLDAASGSVEILAEVVAGQDSGLRPGMELQAELVISVAPGRLTIPRSAVQMDDVEPAAVWSS